MVYQVYRATTLGLALQATLEELLREGILTEQLVHFVLATFDKCMTNGFKRVHNKVEIKDGKLRAYRYCDNVWTLILDNMGIIERRFSAIEGGPIDRIKIVACDGNMEKLLNPFGTEPTMENSKKRSR